MPERTSAGIQSAGITLSVLPTMAHAGDTHAASELGQQLGMPYAKVHCYLVSLERVGFVEQGPASTRYRLGIQTLQVELSALPDVDFVREGNNLLPKLAKWLNESVFLLIWTARGPIIVRWENSGRPIVVNVRVGSVMPLLNSVTGQACAAWVSEIQTVSLIDHELHEPGAGKVGLANRLDCRACWQTVW